MAFIMADNKNVKECTSDSDLLLGKDESKTDSPGYWINSDSSDFNRKRDNIFSGLLQFDSDHKEQITKTKQSNESFSAEPMEIEEAEDCEEPKSEKQFKIPVGIPARNKRKLEPDYIVHPERWKKYTLQDVTDEDLSDKSNTKAALTFLEERRLLKNIEPAAEINLDIPPKFESFTFKKPEQSIDEDKTDFMVPGRGTKISTEELHISEKKHKVNLDYLNELQKIFESEVTETNKEELVEKNNQEKMSIEEEKVKFKSGKKFNRKNLRDRNNVNDS